MAGSFQSTPYEDFSGNLNKATEWVQSLGLQYEKTRIGEYKRAIDRLLEIYKSEDNETIQKEFVSIVNAVYEANELIAIYLSLAGKFDEKLRSHITTYAKGPSNYTHELVSASSNLGRNIAFELLVMSKLAFAGIEIDFDIKADVAGIFDNRSILIECKRPQSTEKLEANIKDAFKQLERKYRSPVRMRHRGIIAIDISKLINPKFMLYVQANESLLEAGISRLVDDFISNNERLWQTGRNRKTIAVILRLSLMGINEGKGRMLTYCQQYGLTPLNHTGVRNIETARALTEVLADAGTSSSNKARNLYGSAAGSL